jgi:Putative adhesin
LGTPVASATTTDETFTMDPGSRVLSVDLGRGDLLLTPSSSNHLEVRRTMRFSGRKPMVEERADASGARITTHCPAVPKPVCAISYQIAVPDSYVVDLHASSGGIDVRGLIMERLRMEVSSGSTHLEDLTGPVEITSSSGSITGARLGVAEFTARVASGRTNLDFDIPPQRVNVAASSGAVTIRLPARGRLRRRGKQRIGHGGNPGADRPRLRTPSHCVNQQRQGRGAAAMTGELSALRSRLLHSQPGVTNRRNPKC